MASAYNQNESCVMPQSVGGNHGLNLQLLEICLFDMFLDTVEKAELTAYQLEGVSQYGKTNGKTHDPKM